MSEDMQTSSNADMSPDVLIKANILPDPDMLLDRITDVGPGETNMVPSSLKLQKESILNSSPSNTIGASNGKMLLNNRSLCTARHRTPRAKSKSIHTKSSPAEQMDEDNYFNSAVSTSGEVAAETAEKIDGGKITEVQNKTSTSVETTLSNGKKYVEESEIETSPDENKIILGLAESTDPRNPRRDSQKAEDSQCSNKVAGDTKRSDVSQVKRCPYCEFEYRGPRDLAPHVKESHRAQFINSSGRVGYKCLYCNESNTRPRNVRKHMHVSHPDHFSVEDLHRTLKFTCQQEGCTKSFEREPKLRSHLISDHGHTVQKPPLARGKVYDLGRMRERAERVEKGEQPTWGQRSAETKNKASSIHTERHKSSRLRDCHEECWRDAREGSGFLCFYCNKAFTHHSICVGHERTHENKNKEAKDKTNGFRCEHCEETFSSSDLLTQHGQSTHKAGAGDDNQCPECEKCFASAYYIKLHMEAVHDKKAKYVCNDCGKSYLHRNGLNSHRENYHNPAPRPRGSKPARFKCAVCDVSLTSHCGMRAHMNKHNGVRPYVCRYCDRSFTSMNHRTAHESIHSGVKAHRCPICYKVFTNVGTLYNHLYRYKVHGTIPRGSLSGHSSNVDTLLRAAELCQQPQTAPRKQPQPTPRKQPRPIRPKPNCKPGPNVRDVPQQGDQELGTTAPAMAPQGELIHTEPPTMVHSEVIPVQHHNELPSITDNITADRDELSTTRVGDAIWMMSQETEEGDTQVVIESEPAPAFVVPAGEGQLHPLGVEQYVTLLQGGSQVAEGQEIRIVTVEDNSPSSDGNITIPSGQQVAFIIMPEKEDSQTVGSLTENVYIQINMEPQCHSSGEGQQWSFGQVQEAKSELGGDRMVDYNMSMDGVEYVTEQTDFSMVTSSSMHE